MRPKFGFTYYLSALNNQLMTTELDPRDLTKEEVAKLIDWLEYQKARNDHIHKLHIAQNADGSTFASLSRAYGKTLKALDWLLADGIDTPQLSHPESPEGEVGDE